jgi:hypothetical protein
MYKEEKTTTAMSVARAKRLLTILKEKKRQKLRHSVLSKKNKKNSVNIAQYW